MSWIAMEDADLLIEDEPYDDGGEEIGYRRTIWLNATRPGLRGLLQPDVTVQLGRKLIHAAGHEVEIFRPR